MKAAVEAAIDFYNNERPHMSLDGMTPTEAGKQVGEIKKDGSVTARKPSKRLQLREISLTLH